MAVRRGAHRVVHPDALWGAPWDALWGALWDADSQNASLKQKGNTG